MALIRSALIIDCSNVIRPIEGAARQVTSLRSRNVPVVSTLLVNHSFLRELEERGSRRTPIFIIADTFEDEDTTYIFKQLLSIDFHFLRKDVNQRTVFFPLARRGTKFNMKGWQNRSSF